MALVSPKICYLYVNVVLAHVTAELNRQTDKQTNKHENDNTF